MKERNGQPNAIFEGEKLSVSLSASLSVSLADPQSAKQTNAILMKERNKLCACAGGAPPIFSACGRGLLLKLATFDRSVTEAKQNLLSITWPRIGDHQKNSLSVRFQYDPQSVIRQCLNASIIGIFRPTIGSPTLQLQIPIQIPIWSPIRHATVLKCVHNRHFLTYNWFSSLQLQIPMQISTKFQYDPQSVIWLC